MKKHRLHLLAPLFLFAFLLFVPDSPASAIQETAKPDLKGLLQQWSELDGKLAASEASFNATDDPDEQQKIRKEYMELLAGSEKLLKEIRTAAVGAFEADPSNQETVKLLIGLIMNDSEFGRNNEAIELGDQLVAAGVDSTLFETAAKADRLALFSKELLEELAIRAAELKRNDLPQIKIETSKGDMVVELFEDAAPNTVANFVNLVESHFYDGLKFHRVIDGFVAQGGDPNGDGSGGPGYSIACECTTPDARHHFEGSLSMAHAGKDTGGSQFFICLSRTSHLDGKHTVFGRVISGMEVLGKLSRNADFNGSIEGAETDVIKKMTVLRKREHEYVPTKFGEDQNQEQPETTEAPTDQPLSEPATETEKPVMESPSETPATEENADGAKETAGKDSESTDSAADETGTEEKSDEAPVPEGEGESGEGDGQ